MSDHICAVPDEYIAPNPGLVGFCFCIARPHDSKRPTVWGPTEIAPTELRINGPASPLGPCPCDCHKP